jgi:hypothetical protein
MYVIFLCFSLKSKSKVSFAMQPEKQIVPKSHTFILFEKVGEDHLMS